MTTIECRAKALKKYGTISHAVEEKAIEQYQDITVSESIVLGLYNQGVKKFVAIFGHGTTDIAEILRVYENEGLIKTFNVRHETEASHAATALRWMTGEKAAVITSIGPGALQAFAGSLCAASNGIGVYHIYGEETTQDEGFNMQQIPRDEQGLFLRLCSVMGGAYSITDPLSIFSALKRGAVSTGKQGTAQPFFLLAPMNIQGQTIKNCNLLEFPHEYTDEALLCSDESVFAQATECVQKYQKITIKLGRGASGCGKEIEQLANLLDAAIVSGAGSNGVVPYKNPRFMSVGGSKGSLCGNYAMNEADCVIVIGARAVCQWDSSGTAWKNAQSIINFNSNPYHATHYNRSVAISGDAKSNLLKWIAYLSEKGFSHKQKSLWSESLFSKKQEWEEFKKKRYKCESLLDPVWKRPVLTESAAIKIACDFADGMGAVKLFDAGDIQANGFQIVEDDNEAQTITDTGSSYMGFAVSALLATAISDQKKYAFAFSGDGCFMMNPQILIDGIEHGVTGCILLFDNRRMAAISGLQRAQYGIDYKTNDSVAVDYVMMASSVTGVKALWGGTNASELKNALREASAFQGLSFIHIPVYSGNDERSGMGVFGDWNVGSWCDRVQAEHHKIGL